MNTIRDDLNSGKLRQFYVLTGTEEYLCRLYQQRLTKALFPEEDAMNCMMFDGSKTDASKVLDVALTPPFFAERRLIILIDTGWLKSASLFADYLEQIPETTFFVFREKEVNKQNKVYRFIEEHGHIAVFEPIRESDALKYIYSCFRKSDLAISEQNAKILLEQCGNDLTALTNECDKISAYCLGRDEVTQGDILTLTSSVSQGQLFRMVDAIVAKNKKQAVSLYKALLEDQTSASAILYNLVNSFYQFSMVLSLHLKGVEALDIGRALKMSSYVVTKYIKAGKGTSVDRLTEAVAFGEELESRVKNGRLPDRIAVELFLEKQCGA